MSEHLYYAVPIGVLSSLFLSQAYNFLSENSLKNAISKCPDAACIDAKKMDHEKNKYIIIMIFSVFIFMTGLVMLSGEFKAVGMGLILCSLFNVVYYTYVDWNMLNEFYLLCLILVGCLVVAGLSSMDMSVSIGSTNTEAAELLESNVVNQTDTQETDIY